VHERGASERVECGPPLRYAAVAPREEDALAARGRQRREAAEREQLEQGGEPPSLARARDAVERLADRVAGAQRGCAGRERLADGVEDAALPLGQVPGRVLSGLALGYLARALSPPGREPWRRRFGAVCFADGRTEFRVWAPNASSVAVRLEAGEHALEPVGDGVFESRISAAAGERYRIVLDGHAEWPDPWSSAQPDGLRGPSCIVDTGAFEWTDTGWQGVRLDELVLYELQVGTFSPEGTFDGVIPRLRRLRELGVTAIELMPVATFPGTRGWGYDGVYISAPHTTYGGPEALARLVDAAHAEGLAVFLDVVYNHVGPGSEAIAAFGPWFTDRHTTFWGDAIDYEQKPVREWALQNAELWVRDYHVDGLRLDATHAIFDESPKHVLAELAERVRAVDPHVLVTSELELPRTDALAEWGHDAIWQDSLHHAVHVLLTGERDGYYARYGSVADVAREFEHPEGRRFIVCAQNHDQVGNRALGDRLHGAKLRLAAFCAILSPGTPLLFMGEEHDEPQPFQFFTDHTDPAIAEATREGRRREFAKFAAFSGEDVPDPQDEETFLRSKLSWREDEEHRAYYRELLRLRRELADEPATSEVDEERRLLRVRRGPVQLVMNFSDVEQDGVPPWAGAVRR
jgi:maltooligosyltrehalose trehalohydrolase